MAVARLKAAGSIIFGKSNTPLYATVSRDLITESVLAYRVPTPELVVLIRPFPAIGTRHGIRKRSGSERYVGKYY